MGIRLRIVSALTGASIAALTLAAYAANDQLVMASWGGIFKEATANNIAKPFTDATGIPVSIADVGGGWAAKIEPLMIIKWSYDALGAIAASPARYGDLTVDLLVLLLFFGGLAAGTWAILAMRDGA